MHNLSDLFSSTMTSVSIEGDYSDSISCNLPVTKLDRSCLNLAERELV